MPVFAATVAYLTYKKQDYYDKSGKNHLEEMFGLNICIVAVCDLQKGSVADHKGLDPQGLIDSIERKGDLSEVPAPHKNWNAEETIMNSGADILIELSYTDLNTGEPAITHIEHAFFD